MFTSRRSNVALFTVIAALVAAAASAPGASAAAQRYANPDGSGTDCSSAKPCDIAQAVNAAGDEDEVIVRPGNYTVTQTLENQARIHIHGVAGQPRPRLYLNAASQVRLHLSVLTYVEVIQNSPTATAVASIRSTLNQVIVRGGDQADCAVGSYTGGMLNSIVVARSQLGDAICTESYSGANNSTYVHVTAVARDGAAINASASGATASVGVVALNVIAKAGPSGAGFAARNGNLGIGATIEVWHSNYQKSWTSGPNASVASIIGNQGLAPAFVDEAKGDYRQRAGSPTIDAGKTDLHYGRYDVDGDPRSVGTADMGADEFVVAPTAATGAASSVTEGAATLSGIVSAKGAPTSYRFEYGPTPAYGNSTADIDAGSGLSDVAASASIAGLNPGTTYHYRVVASNAAGVVHGVDQTFTTASASGTGEQPPPPGSFAGVKLLSSRLALKGRFIVVKLSCPAGTAGKCAGVTKLTARRPRTASRAATTVKLGRAAFSISAGGQAKVKVRVSRAGRRLFAHTRRLRGRAANAAHDAAGLSKTTSARVIIRRG